MNEQELFEQAMAKRRRAVEMAELGIRVGVVVVIVLLLLTATIFDIANRIDCADRACPLGQHMALVGKPEVFGRLICTCVPR